MSIESIKVADIIIEQKATYAAFSFAVASLTQFYPIIQDHLIQQNGTDTLYSVLPKANQPINIVNGIAQNMDKMYKLDVGESIRYVNENKLHLKYLTDIAKNMVLEIGHALAQHQHFDRSPEIEFFRHIRNGLAHGNKFTFNQNQPSKPAYFNNFVITKQLEGQRVLIEASQSYFLEVGDLLELMDFLEEKLRSM